MAKRKAARSTGRGAAKKTARKTARKAAKRAAAPRKAARKGTKKAAGRKAARKAAARKSASRKATARKAAARKAPARRKAARAARPKPAATARKSAAKTANAKRARPSAPRAAEAPVRKAPALDRPRRTITDTEDLVPTPPSSLDLDRSASAVRTGRQGMRERYSEHTETSPALTGGDVDADWEGAYSSGDEAPGGDNPTPDQDIVDEIGHAIGVEYEDNEELKGDEKIAKRDRNRWELDPASSEDYPDRD
ncbi:MAG TPA: DUF6335 family protein [Vicinamibacterales bacterium]|nr:DUF6335 family protein [Vicinamibacterales bacterium]